MDDHTDDRYLMLFCDDTGCRVNTFEHGADGACPGCGSTGGNLR